MRASAQAAEAGSTAGAGKREIKEQRRKRKEGKGEAAGFEPRVLRVSRAGGRRGSGDALQPGRSGEFGSLMCVEASRQPFVALDFNVVDFLGTLFWVHNVLDPQLGAFCCVDVAKISSILYWMDQRYHRQPHTSRNKQRIEDQENCYKDRFYD